MIPAVFDYFRPQTVEEALELLAQHGEDAKLLAGAHSLLPAMKLRLAQPKALIDLGRLKDLNYIRLDEDRIALGAMTPHHEIELSPLLRQECPLLSEVAPRIGDVQVRNRGTVGGSLAHADPASDWPAAILALDADLEVAGPKGRRTIPAAEFFVDLYQTALAPDEILLEIRLPRTGPSVAYVKTIQRASGFAIAGSAVVLAKTKPAVRVAITGVAAKPYRATGVEEDLEGGPLTPASFHEAAQRAADGIEALGDIHASPEFRAHLARVNTARALQQAGRDL